MRHDIVIQPITPMRMTKLPRTYAHQNGKMYLLTENFELKQYENSRYIAASYSKNPETYPIEHTQDITFNNSSFKPSHTIEGKENGMNHTQVYKFSYETKFDDNGVEVGVTSEDQDKKKAHELFFGRHPMTLMNGKPHENTKTPTFDVIDFTKVALEKEISHDIKLQIANRIHSMGFEEKCDVAYYFGVSPKGMREKELENFLADFSTGICMNSKVLRGGNVSNVDRFIQTFINGSDQDRDMHIMLEKAVFFGLFENRRDNDMDCYYLGTSHVGNNIEEMISYFKKDEKMYNDFIVGQVQKKEDYSAEKKESVAVAKNVKKEQVGTMSELDIQAWRDRATILKKENYIPMSIRVDIMKIEKLMPLVEQAEKLKKEKEVTA